MDAFEQWVRGGMAVAELEVDESDLQVMRFIDGLYGPALRALLSADLKDVWPETDLDPSRAPSGSPPLT